MGRRGEKPEECAIKLLKALVRPLGHFLTFLHRHEFPPEVLEYIPRAEESFEYAFGQANRRLKTIVDHTSTVDLFRSSPRFGLSFGQIQKKLMHFEKILKQRWGVTHCDLSLNHLFMVSDGPSPLAVIDFEGASIHDPSMDFAALASELREDLPKDDFLIEEILRMILEHYQTDDDFLIEKIEFWFLTFEIQGVYNQLKNGCS